jgi:hypothetical protein
MCIFDWFDDVLVVVVVAVVLGHLPLDHDELGG